MDEFNRRALELDRSGSGLMLFVAGAVVGAAAALIFAPAAGRDTREFLGRRSRELADDVTTQGKKLWDEHGDRITSAVRKGYDTAKGTASDAVNGAADPGQAM